VRHSGPRQPRYEAEDYGDSEFDAANENWDLQIKRDAEAERKYGEYLDRYDDQYDYFWDDWDDDWDDDDDFIKENKSEPELTVVDGVPTPPKTHWNGYEWATTTRHRTTSKSTTEVLPDDYPEDQKAFLW